MTTNVHLVTLNTLSVTLAMWLLSSARITQGPTNGYPLCSLIRWKFNSEHANWLICYALKLWNSEVVNEAIWWQVFAWRSGSGCRSGWGIFVDVLTFFSTIVIIFDNLKSKFKTQIQYMSYKQTIKKQSQSQYFDWSFFICINLTWLYTGGV